MFVLIHSPLVGPSTWHAVAHTLRAAGHEVAVPALSDSNEADVPYWRQHAGAVQQALRSVPTDRRLILVGHSGAGPLLPVIRQQLPQLVAAYVFADAGVPRADVSRLDLIAAEAPDWFESFREFLKEGGRFPDWRDEDLIEEIPDKKLRANLVSEIQPRALPFWIEPIPVFAGWPDAPCAYVQFSPSYHVPATQAHDQGWLYCHLPGGHFLPVVDPQSVARTFIDMIAELGIDLKN